MRLFLKRLIDLLVAVPALIVLSPVMLATAMAVRLTMGNPVLFRQLRPGKNAVPFTLLKFRSMSQKSNDLGNLLSDKERLTGFGCFLRKASLDELPQLWNVVRGELSLVGPRPLLMQYLDRYRPEQARRHEVAPGITGWAQVNGRNAITWEQKFALDVWYVDNWSLFLDLRILLKTIVQVFRREGISQAGSATALEFMGSESSETSK